MCSCDYVNALKNELGLSMGLQMGLQKSDKTRVLNSA